MRAAVELGDAIRRRFLRSRERSRKSIGKCGKLGDSEGFGGGGFRFTRQRNEPGRNLDLFGSKRGRHEIANWGSRLDLGRCSRLQACLCELQELIGNFRHRRFCFRNTCRNRGRRRLYGSLREEKRAELLLKARGLQLELLGGGFGGCWSGFDFGRFGGCGLGFGNGRRFEERRDGRREIWRREGKRYTLSGDGYRSCGYR